MNNDDTALLSIRGLTKSYGDLTVLKSIDLDLKKGEILGIIGPSGSGKSTLIRCLNMMEMPTAVSIKLLGKEISNEFGSSQ